jgi:uncharacterized protein (TIGR00369 family)
MIYNALMKYKVTGKQENSRMCLVCGTENLFGLKARFYSLEDGSLAAVFMPGEEHQGYPGRLHGGIAASVLDETIGRAVAVGAGGTVWGVTVELSTRYRKPVPLGVELRAVARITADRGRVFEGSGELLLPDGSVAVEASGRYLKMSLESITGEGLEDDLDWRVLSGESDPEHFDVPESSDQKGV